jgi:hypothetical protein
MSAATEPIEDRARRLLRWYPKRWRDRYGEEFAELLVAELDEQPRNWRRTADIASSGLAARLSVAGLSGSPIAGGPQAALATIGAATVAFLACGLSLWSQLLVGWRWSSLDGHAVRFGVLTMSVAGGYLAVLAVLAAVPVIATVGRALRAGDCRRLVGPAAGLLIGVAMLLVGGHHLQGAWPGAGGHTTHLHRFVPSPVAGFSWAETLAFTSYWIHPAQLLAQPVSQVVWIVASPMVLAATVTAAVRLVRRVTLPRSVLAYEARLARAAAAGMALYLGAGAWWVVASRAGSNSVFRAGSLDLVLIVAMAASLAVAGKATRQLHRGATLISA